MNNYFRITTQSLDGSYCFIADSCGHFEKLWQFSAYLIVKGFKIIAVNAEGKFDFGNIPKADPDPDHIIIRACAKGKVMTTQISNGQNYDLIIQLNNKIYKVTEQSKSNRQ